MWHGLRVARQVDHEFVASASELLQATLRDLILVTGGIFAAWQIVIPMLQPELGWKTATVSLIIVPTTAIALWLHSRHFAAAQVVWQIGFAAGITRAILAFQEPQIGFCYPVLPLVAAITVGWPASVLVEGALVALVWWLSRYPGAPPLLFTQSLGIVLGGTCAALVGWAGTRALLTVTQWSVYSYGKAREKMEEARAQRVELKEIQEDLILANRELARLSDRLQAMYQVAEEARRAKEEFVANVSHELRTPLNMIIGYSEMILEWSQLYGASVPPALLSDVAAIERNSRHLARLIDDVLDLSQIEAGRMALSREWASPQEIIEAAVAAVRGFFESKGLYLETEVAPDLPQVFCDSTRIRQVIINLLSNAGRFTEQGGVRVSAWREGDAVVIGVADTGPGIAAEDHEKVFEPFRQLDGSTRRRHGGTGLGLSISKRFVEMHGGRMWLESQVGQGATFYLSLPLEAPVPTASACGAQTKRWFNPYDEYEYRTRTRPSKAPAPAVPPRYVLLDRGDTLQRLFRRYLHGFEVVAVRDTEEAARELSRLPAQALVVNAPPFANISPSLTTLADLPYGTPIVACNVPGAEEAVRQLGVARYLVKPVTREMLLTTLEAVGHDVRRILVVDDDPEALQLFARMLVGARRGYRVMRAESGQQALTLLRRRRPDVMLLDLVMPGIDGFQVLNEMSQDADLRGIPVVVVTCRDPSGQPIVTNALTVTRSGGLAVHELLACIQAVSRILAPTAHTARPEPSGRPGG